MGIRITEEMRVTARKESGRRAAYIQHHFGVGHLTPEETDEIGFLGEFACCELLGIDWRGNIRDNYYTIDSGDININNKIFDVKTETIPQPYFDAVINRRIKDDELYGRRLINEQQFQLLNHYDYVIFGGFVRDAGYNTWYPLGYIDVQTIIENYRPIIKRPDGGGDYPSPAAAIKTSEIGRVNRLMAYVQALQSNFTH